MSEVDVSRKSSESPSRGPSRPNGDSQEAKSQPSRGSQQMARSGDPSRSLFLTGWNRPLSPYSSERISPLSLMGEMTGVMDRMLRAMNMGSDTETWAPAIDVQHCDGNLTITADLPGLRKEDVKVEANEDSIVIQGERKQEHKEDHAGFHRWERSYGQFYRAIPLPEGSRTDQVKAELKDGVLKVWVPVPEGAKKARQIPVGG